MGSHLLLHLSTCGCYSPWVPSGTLLLPEYSVVMIVSSTAVMLKRSDCGRPDDLRSATTRFVVPHKTVQSSMWCQLYCNKTQGTNWTYFYTLAHFCSCEPISMYTLTLIKHHCSIFLVGLLPTSVKKTPSYSCDTHQLSFPALVSAVPLASILLYFLGHKQSTGLHTQLCFIYFWYVERETGPVFASWSSLLLATK